MSNQLFTGMQQKLISITVIMGMHISTETGTTNRHQLESSFSSFSSWLQGIQVKLLRLFLHPGAARQPGLPG